MTQRRQRIGKEIQRRQRNLALELKDECEDCFTNTFSCEIQEPGFDCPHEGDGCFTCSHFKGNCNPSSCCPGSLDPVLIIRDKFKGHPFNLVKFTV